ncbi:MAG: SixA phosphatase family protein [Flavobacteriaceae bacterium]
MKTLYLIRHAKSSWKHQVDDLYRPLKKRGVSDAKLVAQHTKELFENPDIVLCSPSKRTQHTAKIFQEFWDIASDKVIIKPLLYDFSGEELIKTITKCNDDVNILMIFAHNFAVTDFVNTFGTLDIDSVPTCGFICIDFEINSWRNLTVGKTFYKVFPKDLK